MKKIIKFIKIAVLGFFGILFLIIYFYKSPTDGFTYAVAPEKPKEYTVDQAKRDCKWAVKDTLHDPSSAEFDNASRFYSEKKKDSYFVQVTGRAKNGFGAMRILTANCVISLTGKIISIKEIK